jgi:hypothetical protein
MEELLDADSELEGGEGAEGSDDEMSDLLGDGSEEEDEDGAEDGEDMDGSQEGDQGEANDSDTSDDMPIIRRKKYPKPAGRSAKKGANGSTSNGKTKPAKVSQKRNGPGSKLAAGAPKAKKTKR